MALFLLQEWEPDICLIDDRLDTVPLLLKMRETRGLSIGLIVFSLQDQKTRATEEQVFRCGADHFCRVRPEDRNLDLKPLYWRAESLWQRVQRHKSTRTSTRVTSPLQPLLPHLSDETPQPLDKPFTLHIGELEIQPEQFIVKRRGDRLTLTPIQFRLLLHFVNHPETLMSRPSLKEQVWGNSPISLRTIDAQISKLKKLIPEVDLCLINIYGKGYIFTLTGTKKAA